jgi:pilus assembly protein Flp/PilA
LVGSLCLEDWSLATGRNPCVSRYYFKASKEFRRLRAERHGVVSFEYVLVAACVVAAIGAAFGTDAGAGLAAALTSILNSIIGALPAAV